MKFHIIMPNLMYYMKQFVDYKLLQILSMSYKAIFDLFLHIHSFSNIDLPSQGLFRLRATVYQLYETSARKQQLERIYAVPFQFMEPSKKRVPNSKKIFHSELIQPPYFYSKTGAIRFSDDIVILDDKVRFKLEIQSFPRLNSENIYIQIDLFFSECYYSSSIHEFEGVKVQTKTFKLENMEHGILNYCEGQFIGNYSSKLSFTIFACLSNFKFGRYKLPEELQATCRQDNEGNIRSQYIKPVQNVRKKQLQRCKIMTFDQFLKWIGKYYTEKVSDPLKYFYDTYVKNLRYYFYLVQQKLNSKSIISKKIILKVPKKYLQLPQRQPKQKVSDQTEVSEKQFRKYMTEYEPNNLTPTSILEQINTIHFDIYMFLMEIQKQFQLDQLMLKKMKQEYDGYIKQRYGQRVFKSTVLQDNSVLSNREHKKIAKNMREKQKKMKLINYPVQDMSYIQSKQMLQFLFYEITIPKKEDRKQHIVFKSLKGINQGNFQQTKQKKYIQQIGDDNILNLLNQDSIKQKNLVKEEYLGQKKQGTPQKYIIHAIDNMMKQKQQKFLQTKIKNGNQSNETQNKQKIVLELNQKKQSSQSQQSMKQSIHQKKNIWGLDQIQQKAEKDLIEVQRQNTDQFSLNRKHQHYLSDDQDVYKSVSHEKGQIDSEQSQKSLDHHHDETEQQNSSFSGISNINLNEQSANQQRNFQTEQPLAKLIYGEKDMLVVMCHGFQGSSFDMAVVVRRIKQLLPQAAYLISRANQGRTQENIDLMGQRLAEEVQNYVKNYMDKNTVIINFVGHSMGGVIARAAIKYLPKYLSKQFGFFCSLSTPHLGYLTGVDGMIKAGLWAILKFKSIVSLQQLTMEDEKDIRKSFLYRLSKQGSLKRFRRIILLSSFEDSYVSWHSARISFNSIKKNSGSGKIEQQMISSILGNQPIHRIDVNFNVKSKNLDSFIGRTAHINLIVQQSLFKIIKATMPDIFNLSKQ